MTPTRQILRGIGLALMFLILALILLFVLALFGNASFELIAHLVAGFVFFLQDHLPRVSTDHATWLPGIAAFLTATGFGHLLLKRLVRDRGGVWKLKSTLCLILFVPVLFVVSFIIPGALLQVNSLGRERWFERSSISTRARATMNLRNLAIACQVNADDRNSSKYPDSLTELDLTAIHFRGWIRGSGESDLPVEPPIYLGAGMPIDTLSDDALLISPAFEYRGSWQRVLLKFNGETSTIPAAEAEVWIDRALEKRR